MVFENNVAVAATALTDRPPFSYHSNIIFENAVQPMVLATFCVDGTPERPGNTFTNP